MRFSPGNKLSPTKCLLLALVLGALFVGCALIEPSALSAYREKALSESSGSGVERWFDLADGDLEPDIPERFEPSGLGGTSFLRSPDAIERVSGSSVDKAYCGADIVSAYFYDVTGDGRPDLCMSALSREGYGIVVFDSANDRQYTLFDGFSERRLVCQDGTLYVEIRDIGSYDPGEFYALSLSGGKLVLA